MPSLVQAADVYEHPGTDGEPTLSDSVPPESIDLGYKRRSDDARILEEVPSKVERDRAARDAEADEAKAQAAAEEAATDAELSAMFPSVDDARLTKKRLLADNDEHIEGLEGELRYVRLEQDAEERALAEDERAGRQPNQARYQRRNDLVAREEQLTADIQRRQDYSQQLEEEWDAKIERLEALYDQRSDGRESSYSHRTGEGEP